MASARVKIEIVGASEVMRTVRGVRRETDVAAAAEKKALADVAKATKKAEQEKTRAVQQAAAAEKRAAEQAAKARTKAEQDAAKAAQREAAKQRQEADRLAQHWAKLAQRSADHRMRAESQVTRQAAQEARKRLEEERRSVKAREDAARRTIRNAGGAVGSVVGGAIAGAAIAGSTARGITGVDDAATRVRKANDFRERLILTAGQAGLDDAGTAQVQAQVMGASLKSGKGADELVGVLETGQAQFNDLKFFADNLERIAVMAKTTGSDTQDFARALGFVRQAFSLNGKEAMDAANLMIAASSKGSIEVKDFARDFASVAGVFSQSTGMTGMEGVREFLGVSQAAGTLGAGSAETATMVERLVAFMKNPEHVKELRQKTGVNVTNKTPREIVEALANNAKFNKGSTQAEIFGGDIIANKAITSLIAAYNRVQQGKSGAIDIASIAGVDASVGEQQTGDIMRRMESSGVLDMQRQAIEMQNDTITHLSEYNAQILSVTKATNAFEKAMGTFALWAGAIGGGAAVTGGISLATKLLGGGGAAAGAGAAGAATVGGAGLLATLGTGTAALAGGTIAAGVGVATGAGLLAGYGLNKGSEALFGKSISDAIVGLLIDDIKRQEHQGMGPPIEGEVKVKVDVQDNRVNVTTGVTKSRGARVSTSAGPNMGGAL